MKWISVNEKLPPASELNNDGWPEIKEYLVVYEDAVRIGSFVDWNGTQKWSISWIHSRESLKVTHWMEIPALP